MALKEKICIQEELERRILHGLSCEWENAIWVLSPTDRHLMKKPLFSLKDMKTRLGYWSGKKREICLGRRLVYRHSWDVVREILLHEIAHQFTEQVLGISDAPPHGPCFQKACRYLGTHPNAIGCYPYLKEDGMDRRADPTDRILIRIKKLMALAESKNRYEAEAAMLKAHELIQKYNIELLSENRDRNFISVFLGEPKLRHHREEYHLANILQDFYFVEGVWISAYVLSKGKMGRVLEISGTCKNIRMADYVFEFVNHFIDAQWRSYNQEKGLNRYRKTDFAVGIMEGFRSKLEDNEKTRKTGTKEFALVKIEDPLLKKYIDHKYPRTVNAKKSASSHDKSVFEDGRRIGRTLVLHQGISDKKVSRKRIAG